MAMKTKEAPVVGKALGNSPLPADKMKQIYSNDGENAAPWKNVFEFSLKQGKFAGNYYPAVGQEATEVGCAVDLRPTDTVAPSHRDFIANLIKGVPLNLMFAHLFARKILA